MDKCVVNNIKAGDARRDYGMMNYGDWWGERGFNWGNIEYDDAHVWMVQFARTGDTRSFMLGDRAAKHYGDVDCIHYCADTAPAGRRLRHCLGHVGGFFAKMPVDGGMLNTFSSPCHTRTEGLVEHYLLTGQRLAGGRRGHRRAFRRRWMNNYDMSNCRIPGWHIVLTMSLYNATGDPFYFNAAKIIGRRAIQRRPRGGLAAVPRARPLLRPAPAPGRGRVHGRRALGGNEVLSPGHRRSAGGGRAGASGAVVGPRNVRPGHESVPLHQLPQLRQTQLDALHGLRRHRLCREANRRGGPGETLAQRDQGPRGEDRRLRPQRDALPASALWDMDRLEDKQQATTVLGGVCLAARSLPFRRRLMRLRPALTTGKTCR